MYEPSLEEMEAFGYVGINDNDVYFENVDSFMVNAKQEDFATKPYLQLLGAAEIAHHTPEFFGYNVSGYYDCGDKRVYLWDAGTRGEYFVSIESMGYLGKDNVSSRTYDFYTVEDAKSYMFRLVLCWLKQESEK